MPVNTRIQAGEGRRKSATLPVPLMLSGPPLGQTLLSGVSFCALLISSLTRFHVVPLNPLQDAVWRGGGDLLPTGLGCGVLTTLLTDSWFDKSVVFKNLKCRTPLSVCLYFWNICITYN